MTRLFLPQTTLEEWALEEKADLQDGRLVLPGEPATFAVSPAVHFTHLVSGEDEQKLLGKVKTDSQLQAIGAEQMADSVVLGDNAYEVVPGYVAEVPPAEESATAKPAVPGAAAETDLLAALLLNKLS